MVYRERDWKAMYEQAAECLVIVGAENTSLRRELVMANKPKKPEKRSAAQIVGAGLSTAAVTSGVGAAFFGMRIAAVIGMELLLIAAVIIITMTVHLEFR